MDDEDLRFLQGFMHTLADLSAETILPFFRAQPEVTNKRSGASLDPVTQADRSAEAVIRSAIKAQYPSHGVLGEEYGTDEGDGEHLWIIDPIDGTKGFISGLPTWGTLIGLQVSGQMELGLMNQPYTGERYVASRLGATLTDRFGTQGLQVRECADLEQAMICATHPDMFSDGIESSGFASVSGQARLTRFGTDCYGYCSLAAGHLDLVIEAGLAPYDILPLIPIVEAAGGMVTDWNGDSATRATRVIAAGDPRVHEATLELLAQAQA